MAAGQVCPNVMQSDLQQTSQGRGGYQQHLPLEISKIVKSFGRRKSEARSSSFFLILKITTHDALSGLWAHLHSFLFLRGHNFVPGSQLVGPGLVSGFYRLWTPTGGLLFEVC